uniref:phosphatidylinositol-3,5-bisphosphate 3-phosphatase n=1 Tax=Ascaris suum TaxID=6253 RepID=F1KTD4_ASCSU
MPATEAIPITPHHDGAPCNESIDDFSHSIDTLSDVTPIEKVHTSNATDCGSEKRCVTLPVEEMFGESLEASTDTVNGRIYLTQYRIIIIDRLGTAVATIPLLTVDSIETRDIFILQINCKNGRVFKVTAESSEVACEWFKKLMQKTCSQRSVNDVFAWRFAKFAKQNMKLHSSCWLKVNASCSDIESSASDDFDRLCFDPEHWRISDANTNFDLCETYPQKVIVPKSLSDEELRAASEGRFLNRFPAVVWRCKEKETVLLRSSQPRVGLFSYRYPQDERILECVRNALPEGQSSSTLLIIDARSYTAAFANRAKGGGFESAEYYRQTEVQFMGLPNIHNIRYSFNQLRALLSGPREQATFLQSLQTTQWLHYLTSLIDAALQCVAALVDDGRSVLVHCSDGWDRTTQIVSLAKLIADPYYRTIAGFMCLIRREWIDFGHKFGDRTGVRNADPNERSPVFLQWLDCVHQLQHQFPAAFQFTRSFLTKLAQHCYSGMFGTFLWNSLSERRKMQKESDAETLSVWCYLNEWNPQFVNVVYEEPCKNTRRLRPAIGVENIVLWNDLYMGPVVEQRINAPEDAQNSILMGLGASQHSEADRCSLNRAHSAESLSNIDAIMCQSTSNQPHAGSYAPPHALSTRSSLSTDTEPRPDESDQSASVSTLKQYRRGRNPHIARELDADGLTKMVDVYQERARKRIDDYEKKIRSLEQRLSNMERERKRYTSGLSAEFSSQNASRSLGDESSDSGPRSFDSILSSISMIDKDDASDISEGSKGWLVDGASQTCMSCQQPFLINNRRHHCRNCGKLFCGACTNFTYHRVQDSKGEQVRVCFECYSSMSRASGTPAIVGTSTPLQSSTSQNRTPTHQSPPPAFFIGSANGQTVFG